MFQAAVAALDRAGFHGPKWRHAAIQSEFSSRLTNRRKLYPHRLTGYLAKGRELRLMADYDEAPISRHQAAQTLERAADFVAAVEKDHG
jgi:hypothetical protein